MAEAKHLQRTYREHLLREGQRAAPCQAPMLRSIAGP